MMNQLSLRELKGAPLSIILALMLEHRSMSEQRLSLITGYSDTTLRKGLSLLVDQQIVSRIGRTGFQLTGENIQLPLYWDEQIQPLDQPEEISVRSEKTSDLENRIRNLEIRVRELENRRNFGLPEEISVQSENISVCEETPVNNLININIPEVSKKVSKYTDTYLLKNNSIEDCTDTETEIISVQPEDIPDAAQRAWDEAMFQMKGRMGEGTFRTILGGAVLHGYADGHFTAAVDSGFKKDWAEQRVLPILEQMLNGMMSGSCSVSFIVQRDPETDTQETASWYEAPSLELLPGDDELTTICNEYLLEPSGINYTEEELRELISRKPDPEVLRFVLPVMTSYESAKYWCGLPDLLTVKRILLKKYGIVNGMAAAIIHNDAATLEMIHSVCEELCPENKNAVGDRIRQLTSDGKIPEF